MLGTGEGIPLVKKVDARVRLRFILRCSGKIKSATLTLVLRIGLVVILAWQKNNLPSITWGPQQLYHITNRVDPHIPFQQWFPIIKTTHYNNNSRLSHQVKASHGSKTTRAGESQIRAGSFPLKASNEEQWGSRAPGSTLSAAAKWSRGVVAARLKYVLPCSNALPHHTIPCSNALSHHTIPCPNTLPHHTIPCP